MSYFASFVRFIFIVIIGWGGFANAQTQVTYTYKPNGVYAINAGLGIATQLVLDPADKIRDYGSGFSSGWDVVRRDHIFYLKPKAPDAETNMYIRTEKRAYVFDLKIVTKDWKRIEEAKLAGVNYVVGFRYPDQENFTSPLIQKGTERKFSTGDGSPVPPENNPYLKYYLDYEFSADSGSRWMVPLRVYDDGTLTYVHMLGGSAAPVFFARNMDRGEESMLNVTVERNIYKIHGVFPFLIIRSGDSLVAVRRR